MIDWDTFEDFDEDETNDEEFNAILDNALEVSEASGIPFDHIMGEYLAGLR